jgi:glycosyltransferase involved in cell wall biosynthesis
LLQDAAVKIESLSAVMPARNEERGIEAAVARTIAALERLGLEFELIVVDDCSSDRTGALLDALAQTEPRLRVLHLRGDAGGYGWALRAAFAAARHPWVFFTDSDMQFEVGELDRLLPLALEADVVVGYRIRRAEGRLRQLTSRGYNLLARAVLPIEVRDVNCAFKLIRRELLERIELQSRLYCVNVELLVLARQQGARVREVGVSHFSREQGESKVGPLDVVRATLELGKLKARLWSRPSASRAAPRSR